MIFHTINTITIDRFGLLQKDDSFILRLPLPLPKKIIQREASKLTNEYIKLTNKDKIESDLEIRYHIVSLDLKLKMLATMYDVLRYSWVLKPNRDILLLFKKHFKTDFEYTKDLPRLLHEIKKTKDKRDVLVNKFEIEKQAPKEFDFTKMIIDIEAIIETKIGKEPLYKLPLYVKQAETIIKNRTHGRNK